MSLAFLVFTGCVLAAAYPILIYPVLVTVLARLRPRRWREAAVTEPVVHVISVHNEERRIRAKLENTLALTPPAGGVRTIVADDGSTDATAAIVGAYRHRGIEWLPCPRQGKEGVQLEAIQRSGEPILVFSDASAMLEGEALVELIRPLADPGVGAVSGRDRLDGGSAGTGEDLYVRYEMAVRQAESLAGSLVGLSGCLFAARRTVAERLRPGVPSDMGAALASIGAGLRAVAQSRAVCRYTAIADAGREFARKRRTALRGLRGLWAYRGTLSLRRPLLSWQVLSHKWLRFLSPFFGVLALAVLVWAALVGRLWAEVLLAGALVYLALGLLSLLRPALRQHRLFRAPGFALVSSAAVVAAWGDLLRGNTQVHWTPTARSGAA